MTDAPARAVFLDRDGVLNRAIVRDGKPYPPSSLAELEILPGVAAALTTLKAAGFVLIGATNQPDVARGTQPRATVEAVNAALMEALPLAEIFVCYHDDSDDCQCRKPRPGLLLQAARQYHVQVSESTMVGDRFRDVEAGHRAGCRTVLIDYGYNEPALGDPPDLTVASVLEAVPWILAQGESRQQRGDR